MPTVLCIEDHPVVAEHVRHWVEQMRPRVRCLTAADGREGLALALAKAPDVVLLDLGLPDWDGFALLDALRAGPRVPAAVAYTARDDDETLRRLEHARVAGVLWKGATTGSTLIEALERVLAGHTCISPVLAGRFDAARLVAPPAVPRPVALRERIVVVKGDRLRAEGVAQAARAACPDADVTVYQSAAAATASLRAAPAALGLIGLTLPDQDGLDLLALIDRERWCRRMLVITGRRDERTLQVLRGARIDGCFDTTAESPSGLVQAIRDVASGGTYFRPGSLDPEKMLGAAEPMLAQILTETELWVFSVVGDGSDDRQAAERLGLSATTVHNHRQNLMRKLGVQTRTELMREALRRGVVRFTSTGGVLTPGLERALTERAARSREPFRTKGRKG
jgi:DNA-binding NarL/FixJ family response regulator